MKTSKNLVEFINGNKAWWYCFKRFLKEQDWSGAKGMVYGIFNIYAIDTHLMSLLIDYVSYKEREKMFTPSEFVHYWNNII